MIAIDILSALGGYFIALWLRYDLSYSKIPTEELLAWAKFAPIYAALTVLVCILLRLYRSIWRFASLNELRRLFFAALILGVLHGVGITFIFCPMPWLYYFVGILLQFLLMTSARFFYRFLSAEKSKLLKSNERGKSRVMIIGAGSAGQMVLRDLNSDKSSDKAVCVIDDDRNSWGRTIEGVKVVGGREDILFNVKKYHVDKIYLAIPSASAEARRDILSICKESDCELKNLPGIADIIQGKVTVTASSMRKVTIEDLLGRAPIKMEGDETFRFLAGKVVLVTGGGGSIGSELCRQIATHSPKQLIVFDVYENNAHEIALEMKDKFPDLDMVALIGSVRDTSRLSEVFRRYKPDIVFHAAAHKHVPLMEYSPCEAIKNNVIGTYKTAYAALASNCQRFVLISTDKAVNPTNIMGASKRLCELVIQSFALKVKEGKTKDLLPLSLHSEDSDREDAFYKIEGEPKTEFAAVRFGNVLGSNGSVVPRFKQQIESGGPVTVTDPDIIRYFMTIPEAASLVLEAGAYAKGGEIFVLDMGSPVRIDTLARNMIKLSGYRPDVDIRIAYTGLRPGEKLYEEKLMDEEGLSSTKNELIHVAKPLAFDVDAFLKQLHTLLLASYEEKDDQIRDIVAKIVPTYHPAGEHGSHNKGKVYEEQVQAMQQKESPSK